MTKIRATHEIITVPDITDARGSLLFAEVHAQVPFSIQRLFVLHALPEGAERGGHAHKAQHQFMLMLAGQCVATIDNGDVRQSLNLCKPNTALYLPPMLWLELSEFSAGAICAVLCSAIYDEADYIRDRQAFAQLTMST